MEMSRALSEKIKKFCKKLTFEYPRDEFNGKSSHMMGYVPDDIEIDRTKGNYFVLYDEYYRDYYEIFKTLRDELSLEYLKDNELKNALWHFTCEIIAGYSDYRNTDRLKEKINEFSSSMLRPLEEYEVLIPILYLDVKAVEIKIGDVTIKKFDELALQDWGIQSDVFRETANKTMAIILEKGNNPKLICDRARRKADFIIRILQVSLSTDLYIHDNNLLFKQDEYMFYRKKDTPSSVRRQWHNRYEFPPLVIDERLEKSINNFLCNISDILEEEKYPPELRERFERALMWIGRSIEEEDPDIKIINLSTALETILTNKSDGKKGETLAYRMLLLNAHVKRPFIDPAKVLWIYELRSNIIHGSQIEIASDHEYSTMKFVAIETLRYSLELIHKLGLKDHNNFIKAIKSYNESKTILDWLKEQGDKRSLEIKKCMENDLAK
jgi:hypothetical protein